MKTNQIQKNIPDGWIHAKASDFIDVRDGTHSTPKKVLIGIPLITSKNIINGDLSLVDSYNVSFNDAVEINKRSEVKIGDILISMIGTVGDAAIIKEIPNFVVKNVGIFKTGSKRILSEFLIKQLHSRYLQNKIKALSSGGIQKFISLGQLRKLPILVPPLPEQNRIVSVLETWDKAIEKLEQKIEAKKQIKKGLMQELLTGRKRLSGFTDKWLTLEFNDLFEVLKKPKGLKSDKYQELGNYPIVDQSKDILISGYTDDEKYLYSFSNKPIVVFGDHSRVIKYINFDTAFGHDGIKTFQAKNNLNIRFGYYLLSNFRVPETGYNRHFKYIEAGIFNTPSFIEQDEIQKILTTADKEINELQKKLSILKEQKRYLLNTLITGTIRTPENLSIYSNL